MNHEELLTRLQIDPGKRTFGELIQDRQAALQEITRLRKEIEDLKIRQTNRSEPLANHDNPRREGTLINIKEVCE